MVETDEHPESISEQKTDQEWLQAYLGEHSGEIEPGSRIAPPQRSGFRLLLLGLLVIAVAGGALFLTKSKGLQLQADAKPIDLGQGVAADSGLRGHLITEWRDKAVHYKLKIEPIDARSDDGFSKSVLSAVKPVYVNLRVLDATGQALCGKQTVLPAGMTLTNGADAFKTVTIGRHVVALWAEGTLPCSPDQYARFDYWDFATSFPTIAEQDKMLGLAAPVVAEQEATAAPQQETAVVADAPTPPPARAPVRHRAVKPKKPQSAFYLEGDDHVSAFERGRSVLTVGPDKSFVLLRAGDAATAEAWADDSLLVHYTCDQRGNCVLRHGGGAGIPARSNN